MYHYTNEESICTFRLTIFQRNSRSYKITAEHIFISSLLDTGHEDPKQASSRFLPYTLKSGNPEAANQQRDIYSISSMTWCSSD